MSAQQIFEHAALGSIIHYSDGTQRPPERHRRKLDAWEKRNNGGRLVRKQSQRRIGNSVLPACITLHKGDYGSGEFIVLRVFQTFSVDSDLTFTVAEQPAVGSVLVLNNAGEDPELVHVAATRQSAEEWLKTHGYPGAVLQELSTEDRSVDAGEGRAA